VTAMPYRKGANRLGLSTPDTPTHAPRPPLLLAPSPSQGQGQQRNLPAQAKAEPARPKRQSPKQQRPCQRPAPNLPRAPRSFPPPAAAPAAFGQRDQPRKQVGEKFKRSRGKSRKKIGLMT